MDKYRVNGFTVPNDGDRYYNIVEIFRMVNTDIDGEQDEAFPKTDKAYPVGQQWYAFDLNGSKHYEMNTFETLYVETVLSDSIELTNGLGWGALVGSLNDRDCWFYCFNQEDYVIKHIFDADLNYSICPASQRDGLSGKGDIEYDYDNAQINQKVTLKDTDTMKFDGNGLFAKSFEWSRILSSKEFLKKVDEQNIELLEEKREKIKASQWVFTFLETEIKYQAGLGFSIYKFSEVYDVGLLRLHFQDISGKYYDLGVVNDLTNPDNIPAGIGKPDLLKQFEEFWEMFVKIILTIVFVIFLVLVLQFVPGVKAILNFIMNAIKTVISASFKLLKSIFKKDG